MYLNPLGKRARDCGIREGFITKTRCARNRWRHPTVPDQWGFMRETDPHHLWRRKSAPDEDANARCHHLLLPWGGPGPRLVLGVGLLWCALVRLTNGVTRYRHPKRSSAIPMVCYRALSCYHLQSICSKAWVGMIEAMSIECASLSLLWKCCQTHEAQTSVPGLARAGNADRGPCL